MAGSLAGLRLAVRERSQRDSFVDLLFPSKDAYASDPAIDVTAETWTWHHSPANQNLIVPRVLFH